MCRHVPGPTTNKQSKSCLTMIRLTWAYTMTRPGHVPQWPKRRVLMCEGARGEVERVFSLRKIMADLGLVEISERSKE